jgi:hypothetical protein
MHNHARFKSTKDGRFILWRSLHLGTRGPAGSEYLLEDTEEVRTLSYDTQRQAECYLQWKLCQRECSPLFGREATHGSVTRWPTLLEISLPDWKEIMG